MVKIYGKRGTTYYKWQYFSVQYNLDESRTFQNMQNSTDKFPSLVIDMEDVHWQKPRVTSHIQRHVLETQFKNFIWCSNSRIPEEIII
jgi:hypothetical protein